QDTGKTLEKAGQDTGTLFTAPIRNAKKFVDDKINEVETFITRIVNDVLAIASKAVWAVVGLSGVLLALLMTMIFRRHAPHRRRTLRTAA
ncbi:MAG: hypothetical protein E6974_08825, partial [Veillonella sp.]|nr:hypothetical protein [Veillonella sp.]